MALGMASLPLPSDHPHAPSIAPGRGARVAYASGNFGKSVVWTAFETLLLFYLVTVAGLSPAVAGTLLTVTLVWDGIAGFLLGYAFDRGEGDAWLMRIALIAAPLAGAAFAAIFLAVACDWPAAATIVAGACVLCRCCYTIGDVAHNTLLLTVTPGGRHAGEVSGLRLIFSAIGATAVGLAAQVLLDLPAGDAQTAGFAVAGVAGGAFYAAFLYVAIAGAAPMAATRRPTAGVRMSLRAALAMILRDPAMARLLLLICCQAGLIPLFVKAIPFAHHFDGWAGSALLVVTAVQAFAQPVWIALVDRRLAPRHILIIGYALVLGSVPLLAFAPCRTIGLCLIALVGIAIAGMNMAIWAVLSAMVQDGRFAAAGLRAAPVGAFLTVLKLAAGLATAAIAAIMAIANAGPALYITLLGGPWIGALLAMTLLTSPRTAATSPYA